MSLPDGELAVSERDFSNLRLKTILEFDIHASESKWKIVQLKGERKPLENIWRNH